MNNVDFYVKVRDAAQMIADAANDALEKLAPSEAKEFRYDLAKIKTVKTEGPSGSYQKAVEQDNKDSEAYKLLLEDLKAHDGKLTKDGFFIWCFDDGKTVGMKPSKK